MPYTFVLVHGSMCHGSHWELARSYLESQGHTVHTPTIGGFAPGADKTDYQTLDSAVQPVVDYLLKKDLKDFVLLGHSYGGIIITQILKQLPERVKHIIYHNAFIPLEGQSVSDILPAAFRNSMLIEAQQTADNSILLPREAFASAMFNDATGPELEAILDKWYPTFTSQPWGQWESPSFLEGLVFDKLDIPKSYIRADKDICLGPNGWDIFPPRLGKYKLVEMEGGHMVMFTNPKQLAEKILESVEGGGEEFIGTIKEFDI